MLDCMLVKRKQNLRFAPKITLETTTCALCLQCTHTDVFSNLEICLVPFHHVTDCLLSVLSSCFEVARREGPGFLSFAPGRVDVTNLLTKYVHMHVPSVCFVSSYYSQLRWH